MSERQLSAHWALREQIDQLASVFEAQRERLEQVQRQLADLRMQATSSDNLVEVTVDAEGTVTRTRVTAKAMRSAPEKVESAFTEAAQAAAAAVRRQREAVLAPLVAEADAVSDLWDLEPGVPSFGSLWGSLLGGKPEDGARHSDVAD